MREDLERASLAELHYLGLQGDVEAEAEADRLEAQRKVRALELALRAHDRESGDRHGPGRDRRSDLVDRRARIRPWAQGSPGRRHDDVLRTRLGEARLALRDAEERLARLEGRRRTG